MFSKQEDDSAGSKVKTNRDLPFYLYIFTSAHPTYRSRTYAYRYSGGCFIQAIFIYISERDDLHR